MVIWSDCYHDNDCSGNRDNCIRTSCKSKGGYFNGAWHDCGGGSFKGQCQVPHWGNAGSECKSGFEIEFKKLWGIPPKNISGATWEEACAKAIGGENDLKTCVTRSDGMYGEWKKSTNKCAGSFGDFRSECEMKGRRKYFSKLNFPSSDPSQKEWIPACLNMGAVKIPNGSSAKANTCVKKADGVYGVWFVDDDTCTEKTTADMEDLAAALKGLGKGAGGLGAGLGQGLGLGLGDDTKKAFAIVGAIILILLILMVFGYLISLSMGGGGGGDDDD